MDQKGIDRINELYRKSKAEGLTLEELDEQKRLRQEYIESYRRNLRNSLESIKIVNPDGSVINVKERHDKKMAEKKHGNES